MNSVMSCCQVLRTVSLASTRDENNQQVPAATYQRFKMQCTDIKWVECRSSQLVPAYHSYGMRDYKKVGDKKAHLAFTQMWDTIAPMIMARNPSMTPNLSYCTGDGRKRRFRTLRALWWHHGPWDSRVLHYRESEFCS
jgi:hypothetical protein